MIRIDPVNRQTRRTRMACAVLSVIDSAFVLATLGWGTLTLEWDFLLWQTKRRARAGGAPLRRVDDRSLDTPPATR
jgi:hypothetical protein